MSSWLIGLIIFVVIGWIWIAYEIYRAPVMPDDYDLSIEEKKVWDELKSKGVDVIAAFKRENQCGCCGVDLTSNEIYEITNSKFQQCPYCMGVVI